MAQGRDFETEYLKREIEGKSNIEIVVMMYDAGIKFMNRAILCIEEKNHEKTHYNITKAQAIVTELGHMLDMENGGEISRNLFNLYGFIQDRLINANIRKDTKMVKEALEIFMSLKEAWHEISHKQKSGESVAVPEKPEKTPPQPEAKEEAKAPQNNVRPLFKNVSNDKDKPYKPFSVKG